ncbi:MAG: hypothetical protein LKJ44_07815 [Bifidobacteriaceae bacterium]|jgi:hypothetical protein|nr:hypothetical protein [Bifidobacteriaceae bacterium]MCI1979592.1 hypothetical protein [Bifidobacteriaceae bacterium]
MENNDDTDSRSEELDPDVAVGLEPVHSRPEDTIPSLMRRVLLYSMITLVVLGIVEAIIGWFRSGALGLASAGVAFALLIVFSLTTPAVFSALNHIKVTFSLLVKFLVISWLVKMVIVIVALLLLRQQAWFDHWLFAIYVVVGAFVVLGIESAVVLTARLPNVSRS